MILYPGENSWNTVRLDKRNYTRIKKLKEQQKEIDAKESLNNIFILMIDALEMLAE